MAKSVTSAELLALLTGPETAGAKVLECLPGADKRLATEALIPWTKYDDLGISPNLFWASALAEHEPPPDSYRLIKVFTSASGTVTDARPVTLEWWGPGGPGPEDRGTLAPRSRIAPQALPEAQGLAEIPLIAWRWGVQTVERVYEERAADHKATIATLQAEKEILLNQVLVLSQWLQRYNLIMTALEASGNGQIPTTLPVELFEELRDKTQDWIADNAGILALGAEAVEEGLKGAGHDKAAEMVSMAAAKLKKATAQDDARRAILNARQEEVFNGAAE